MFASPVSQLRAPLITLLALVYFGFASPVNATDVRLIGLANNTAILVIEGARPKMMRVGQTGRAGVKLLAVTSDEALVEVGGERIALRLGEQPYSPPVTIDRPSVTLVSNAQGHFFTTGTINGATVRLIVDSGASLIAMGPADARRAGIDYLSGEKGYANTANGVAVVHRVQLNKVQVGDIVMHNVAGLVHSNMDLPVVLLGMSFLGRLDMQRNGDTLTLTKRY
ncbi:MAG: TIGR02281 family clan AA aspartic protease [Betaproteobacteria bacterium]|jgi:aspartyl protease family protein|nr:MAG: TIGR02281 family clan AA aspartic protease [Betaproteobacteria bacterium]